MIQREEHTTVEGFVAKVKEALKGNNVGQDIRKAVTALLKSYGIQTPVKK